MEDHEWSPHTKLWLHAERPLLFIVTDFELCHQTWIPLSLPLFLRDLAALVMDWANREGARDRKDRNKRDLRYFEMAIVLNSRAFYEWLIYFGEAWHLFWVWLASCFGKVNPLTSVLSNLNKIQSLRADTLQGKCAALRDAGTHGCQSLCFPQKKSLMCPHSASAVLQWQLINVQADKCKDCHCWLNRT